MHCTLMYSFGICCLSFLPLNWNTAKKKKKKQYLIKPGFHFLIWVTNSVSPTFSCGSDFEFGLGSFSLLEEITSGQEWAKFLTPDPASASADQRPLQEVTTATFGNQTLISNHGSATNRGFGDRGPQVWPGDLQPVSMDVSGQQTEPMEHGHAPPEMRIRWQTRPLSFSQVQHLFLCAEVCVYFGSHSLLTRFHVQDADVQNSSSMKSRVQLNRKRHHHFTERTDKDPEIDVIHPDGGQGQFKVTGGLVRHIG